ncbi:AhpC-TSA-domain-containing protein [Poronia punctata]|nr:AhpC-TSA-domain-containing protein [Poronia punctata]
MPVELRKRKAPPAPAPVPEPPAKKPSKSKVTTAATANKVKAAVVKGVKAAVTTNGSSSSSSSSGKPSVGDIIPLSDDDNNNFGGQIVTNDGTKTSLKDLVDKSKSGVVLFTYPKASTGGCTNQVCLFRDSYTDLTKEGLAIYGLSTDSPKANTSFKTKQNLQYPLLCDPGATLIGAIGFKKTPRGTTRGVFAVDKAGKVLLAEAGGPAATVDAVRKLVAATGGAATTTKEEEEEEEETIAATDSNKPVVINGQAAVQEKEKGGG